MIPKKRITACIYWLIASFIFLSCNESKKDRTPVKAINAEKIEVSDISKLKLTVSRGAFHYDAFQLTGNELTYIPSKERSDDDYPDYQIKSTVILSDSIVVSLFEELLENNILELDSYYNNLSSCSSKLEVELQFNTIEKTIVCEDFKTGCPELLINLENELIKLHGKNLKRIFLPG